MEHRISDVTSSLALTVVSSENTFIPLSKNVRQLQLHRVWEERHSWEVAEVQRKRSQTSFPLENKQNNKKTPFSCWPRLLCWVRDKKDKLAIFCFLCSGHMAMISCAFRIYMYVIINTSYAFLKVIQSINQLWKKKKKSLLNSWKALLHLWHQLGSSNVTCSPSECRTTSRFSTGLVYAYVWPTLLCWWLKQSQSDCINIWFEQTCGWTIPFTGQWQPNRRASARSRQWEQQRKQLLLSSDQDGWDQERLSMGECALNVLEVKPERPDWDGLDMHRGKTVSLSVGACWGWSCRQEASRKIG